MKQLAISKLITADIPCLLNRVHASLHASCRRSSPGCGERHRSSCSKSVKIFATTKPQKPDTSRNVPNNTVLYKHNQAPDRSTWSPKFITLTCRIGSSGSPISHRLQYNSSGRSPSKGSGSSRIVVVECIFPEPLQWDFRELRSQQFHCRGQKRPSLRRYYLYNHASQSGRRSRGLRQTSAHIPHIVA